MEIVVISNPEPIENESTIINELFREGLGVLHLRKPNESENELCKLIEKIDQQYHDKIALHQHFSLTERFKIKRLHFSEKNRALYTIEQLMEFKNKGFTLSTSVHSMEDYNSLNQLFQYAFIGPVFESISKLNYKPSFDIVEQLNKQQMLKQKAKAFQHDQRPREVRIYGIGGVDHTKLEQMKNFDGVALLGAIWNYRENAIEEYKKCRKIANMY